MKKTLKAIQSKHGMLNESYAWEKTPGKALPTLADVQSKYNAKSVNEQEAVPDSTVPTYHINYFIDQIDKLKLEKLPIAFVGDIVGTGSSRKSAINSLQWHFGEKIPYMPNKNSGGIILGNKIAPIFFNTAEDSGALPIECDVSKLKTGDIVKINLKNKNIIDKNESELTNFKLDPITILDELRAGGRIPLIFYQ